LTSAELPAEQKDAISHRGQALRALVPHLMNRPGLTAGSEESQ
jgi:inosine/xanthosine triphosphate pyrophosphatase family protein